VADDAPAPDVPSVSDNAAAGRYEIKMGRRPAVLLYRRRPGVIELVHTRVPEELSGRGLGGMLARFALEAARSAGERVVATCPYVQAYIRKHPEYEALLA